MYGATTSSSKDVVVSTMMPKAKARAKYYGVLAPRVVEIGYFVIKKRVYAEVFLKKEFLSTVLSFVCCRCFITQISSTLLRVDVWYTFHSWHL
jgi:hypothetical protein